MRHYPRNKEELLKILYKTEWDENDKEYTVDNLDIHLGDIETCLISDMSELFQGSKRKDFSGIETWDTSNVTDMRSMFDEASSFNQPLDSWDTSNVTDMSYMFCGAISFNQPLDSWDTSNVTNMNGMFLKAKNFNHNINSWNVSKVEDMTDMFYCAKNFNQDLNAWKVQCQCKEEMFLGSLLYNNPPKWLTQENNV